MEKGWNYVKGSGYIGITCGTVKYSMVYSR